MAFIFGKNKKKQETEAELKTKEKEEAKAREAVVDTQGTQSSIAANREIRKDIERRFRELNDPMFRERVKKVAEKNQDMLDRHAEAHKYDSGEQEIFSDYAKLEKDMYIVSGGYRQAPSENNNVPRTNLDSYMKAVNVLEKKYKNTSSADAVETGADRLEIYVESFLANLRSALEKGYAMKADAAVDLVKYVLIIGYRFEDYTDEAEREQIINNKVHFIETVGKDTVRTVDALYDDMIKYKIREDRYQKCVEDLVTKREAFDSTCPKEVRQLIDTLGYSGAMSQLPPGDNRIKYLDQMLQLQTALTLVLENSLMLEAEMRKIIVLKSGIETLAFEMRQAFEVSGRKFDFNEHMRVLNEIHENNIHEMQEADKWIVANAQAEEVLMGKLEAIANNVELGKTVQGANYAVRDYAYIQKQNEQLVEAQEKRRAEYQTEKRKIEIEKERQRLQERERILNEARELEAQMQDIKEQEEILDSVTVPEIHADEEVIDQATEDNRELIAEDI